MLKQTRGVLEVILELTDCEYISSNFGAKILI